MSKKDKVLMSTFITAVLTMMFLTEALFDRSILAIAAYIICAPYTILFLVVNRAWFFGKKRA